MLEFIGSVFKAVISFFKRIINTAREIYQATYPEKVVKVYPPNTKNCHPASAQKKAKPNKSRIKKVIKRPFYHIRQPFVNKVRQATRERIKRG